MKIEFLYFAGCPHMQPAKELLNNVLRELGVKADITDVHIADNADAIAKRFLGSPSIRINGQDLELAENDQTQYSMRCRIYKTEKGNSGIPPKELLIKRMRQAIA